MDGGKHRRTVARLRCAPRPNALACRTVICRQIRSALAGRADDHTVAIYERRRAGAVRGDVLRTDVLEDVDRPNGLAGRPLQAIEDAGVADGVDAAGGDRRCRAGADAAEALEAGGVFVHPGRRPVAEAVAADAFFVAALLLREGVVADDRERAPALTDRPTPDLERR